MLGIYRKMHIPHDPLYYEKYFFRARRSGFSRFRHEVRQGRHARLLGSMVSRRRSPDGVEGGGSTRLPDGDRLASARKGRVRQIAARRLGNDSARRMPSPMASTSRRSIASASNRRPRVGWSSGARRSSATRLVSCCSAASHAEEQIIVVACDRRRMEDVRRNWPFFRDRRDGCLWRSVARLARLMRIILKKKTVNSCRAASWAAEAAHAPVEPVTPSASMRG